MSLVLALLAGVGLGAAAGGRLRDPWRALLDRAAWVVLAALLFGMGARIGADREVLARAAELGWRAAVLALAATLGSVATVALLRGRLTLGGREGTGEEA